MKKQYTRFSYWIALLLLGFASGWMFGQSTTVNGTIVDPSGNVWSQATVSASFQATPGIPGPYIWSGGIYNPLPATVVADTSGNFTITLPTNIGFIAPSGSTWVFAVCPNASLQCAIASVALSGSTLNLIPQITAQGAWPVGKIIATYVPKVYNENQVGAIPASQGGIIYNTSTHIAKIFDGSVWQPLGGGSSPCGIAQQFQVNGVGVLGCGQLFQSVAGNPQFSTSTVYSANTPFAMNSYNSTNRMNGSAQNLFHVQFGCNQDITVFSGFGLDACDNRPLNFFAAGYNAGDTSATSNTSAGWQITKGTYIPDIVFTRGIHQTSSIVQYSNKDGDDAVAYWYSFNKGGWTDGAGEGHTTLRINGGNNTDVFKATSNQTGTGITTLSVTNTGDNNPMTSGYLANLTTAVTSGNITGCTAVASNVPGVCTTTTTHAISAAFGHTLSAITVSPNTVSGTSVIVPVHVEGGSNAAGFVSGYIFFACDDSPDHITTTAVSAIDGSGNQNITANFQYSHISGCKLYQGGTHGILDLVADRFDSRFGAGMYRTSYEIPGAETTTTLVYRSYSAQTLNGASNQSAIFAQLHNFGSSGAVFGMTRTSNVVTGCGAATNFTGTIINITSAPDSSFNGTFQTGALDANGCLVWNQTAANATTGFTTFTTGGNVGGTNSSGAFFVWPAAMIRQVNGTPTTINGQTTLAFTGSLTLFPNDMSVTIGDVLLGPDNYSNKTNPQSAIMIYTSPPTNGLQNHVFNQVSGAGVTGQGFQGERFINNNPWGMYAGGGGTGRALGAVGRILGGPWVNSEIFDAPLPGGTVHKVGTNPCIDNSRTYCTYIDRALSRFDGLDGFQEYWDGVADKFTVQNFGGYGYRLTDIDATLLGQNWKTPDQTALSNNSTIANTKYVDSAITAAGTILTITSGSLVGSALASLTSESNCTTLAGAVQGSPTSWGTVSGAAPIPGITTSAQVTTANTVCVYRTNNTAAPITTATETYKLAVIQ